MRNLVKDLMDNAVFTLLAPTASGKTDLIIQYAKKYPIEVVSVDSAMVYRELSIGANKPSTEELRACPHHVIDVTSVEDGFDVACFFEQSVIAIDDILKRGKVPVLVGGTMMYIYQIHRGLAPVPLIDSDKRREFFQDFEKISLEEHYSRLQLCDPEFAAGVEKTDKQRIGRGLEVFYLTGTKLSDYWALPAKVYPYNLAIHGLQPTDKDAHKTRIGLRAKAMLHNGFIEEVQKLSESHPNLDYDFWAFVGYRQVRAFLDGQLSLTDLPLEIERSTWQLVKRQKTWLKKFDIPLWNIDVSTGEVDLELSNIFEKYCTFVLEKGISQR